MLVDDMYAQKCATPSDINEHLPVLKEFAIKSEKVVEFGVRHGVSTWALMAGRPRKLDSYDLTNPGEDVLEVMYRAAREAAVKFNFYCQDDLTASTYGATTLFIDTYHSHGQLIQELKEHAHCITRWIILHDTVTFRMVGEGGEAMGLWHAVAEFLFWNPDWILLKEYKNNNGLTILERK